jgi:hypothetical protein
MRARNAHLETERDAFRSLDEQVGDGRLEQLARRHLEELQPVIEVPGVDGQADMHAHRLAMVDPTRQHDGRPELAHALQMRFPVGDPGIEDRPEQRVFTNPRIERTHELLDLGFVDACSFAVPLHDARAALGFVEYLVSQCLALSVSSWACKVLIASL